MLKDISQEALHEIDERYGAVPFTPQTTRAFHNGLHTRNVMEDFGRLAASLPLDDMASSIGDCSAAAHDIFQDLGPHDNERASAEWLSARLSPRVAESCIQMANLAIQGTEPLFVDGILTSQVANNQDYPTRKHERVAKALACADLGRLFQPDGPYLSHLLFQEIRGNKPPESLDQLRNYQAAQVALLERYRYPLAEARVLMTHHRAVSEYTEQVLADIESGELDNWQQLLSNDRKFIIKHS